MSGYALQTLVNLGEMQEAYKVIRYLALQKNEYGGFISTQDTIVAFDGLAKFA